MALIEVIKLLALAGIWGSSFIFMRILAPVLGAVFTANLRILIAGLILVLYYRLIKFDPEWKKNTKHYIIIGIINSAVPFSLFSFAALTLPASYEVILNSTAPLFGMLLSAIWLGEKLNWQKVLGIIVATIGVAVVVNVGSANFQINYIVAIIACLMAAFCYGLGATYIKKYGQQLRPLGIAGCSQLLAGILILPISLTVSSSRVDLIMASFTWKIGACLLALSILCSAIAYLLYYDLIKKLERLRPWP